MANSRVSTFDPFDVPFVASTSNFSKYFSLSISFRLTDVSSLSRNDCKSWTNPGISWFSWRLCEFSSNGDVALPLSQSNASLIIWLNPYLRIMENSSRNFPNFQFSGVWHRRISGKLIQYFFEILISGPELDRFLVYSSIFGWVFQKSVCVTPRNSKIDCWMSFPEIGLTHARIWLKLNRYSKFLVGGVFHKWIQLIPRKLANKGWWSCRGSLDRVRVWTNLDISGESLGFLNFLV